MKKTLFLSFLLAVATPLLQARVSGTTEVSGYNYSDPNPPSGEVKFAGAYSETGNASGGVLVLVGGQEVDYRVSRAYGGQSKTGVAENNQCTTSAGAKIGSSIVGGVGITARNNVVYATDTTIGAFAMGGVAGTGGASNNRIIATNVSVNQFIVGGAVEADSGNANGNLAVLDNVQVLTNEGNAPSAIGGWSPVKGDANNNTLIIAGGKMGDVTGAFTSGIAKDNHVILVGTGPFYDVQDGDTTHRIWGKEMELGHVYGYFGSENPANTAMLDVYGTGITAANISNFTGIQFDLCPCLQPGMTIITLNGGEVTNLTGVAISLEPKGTSTHLKQGSQVTLIKTNGTITGVDTKAITFKSGNFSKFTGSVTLSEDQTALILTVDFIGNDPIVPERDPLTEPSSVKSVLETRANAMALVNGGADFLVSNGIWQVRRTAAAGSRQDAGVTLPFVAVGGSSLRHETGSHIKANGMNLAVGIARQVNEHAIGAAFEYGFSNYDSYVDSLHANGKSKAWGAALLGDWNLGAGWHMDTIARVGKVRNSYSANIGGPVSYNESSTYAGASIGFGYMQKAGENGAFDTYLRYLYSHVNGGNATLSSGNHAHFRGVNSNRTVLGTRYVHELNTTTRAYAGAGWMQQYGCGAHGNVDGYTGPSPSLGGASGLFELGLQYTPAGGKGIGVDVNVTGWVGTQRGISGGIGLRYAF